MKKTLFFAIHFFSFQTIHSHIYQIQIVRIWMPRLREYQYIIGFSDLHDRDQEKNQKHRDALIHLFKQCPKKNTTVIVEDLSSTNHRGTSCCGTFFFDSRGGLLGGIAKEAEICGLQTHNVEYRYCRAAGWGDLYSRMLFKPKSIDPQKMPPIPLQSVRQEVLSTIDVVMTQFKKEPLNHPLRVHAQSAIDSINKRMQKLDWLTKANGKSTITQCASHFINKCAVEETLTFDSALIDLLILDAIKQAFNKTVIVLIAGGTHIDKSFNILKTIGYKQIYSQPIARLERNSIDQILSKIRR